MRLSVFLPLTTVNGDLKTIPSLRSHNISKTSEDTVENARPFIDVLMDSVADQYGRFVVGIILTGGGYDGIKGLQAIKSKGGLVLVQNPKTAQAPLLPQATIDADIVNTGYNLTQLAQKLALLEL